MAEEVLLGQVGQLDGGEAGEFDFRDLFELYDAQPLRRIAGGIPVRIILFDAFASSYL